MLDLIRSDAERWLAASEMTPVVILVLKATAVLAITALLARSMSARSAAKRHVVLSAGIASALALPLAALSIPHWRVPVQYDTAAVAVQVDGISASVARTVGTPVAATTRQSVARTAAVPGRAAVPSRHSLGAALVRLTQPAALVALWLVGAGVVLFPWLLGILARRRLARRATDLLPAPWERALRELRVEGTVPDRVRVLATRECAMPMTWGFIRPIVLIPGSVHWHDGERRNALRHELAHVRRGDSIFQLLTRVLCAIYWFNPVAWIVARAERLAREQACDDAVLRAGSRASAYAEQLLNVARGGSRFSVAVAALTMARPSSVVRRLRAILDVARDRSPSGWRLSSVAMCATFAVVPPLAALTPELVRKDVESNVPTTPRPSSVIAASAPAAIKTPSRRQQATDCIATSRKHSSNISISDGRSGERRRWQVRFRDDACRIELDARGDFTLTPNADDVATIAPGGYFDLELESGGMQRRVRMERGDSIERTYWLNGKRTPWDAAAAAWFAQTIVMLDRRTAFAVDARLPLLLQRGGVEAVMAEVAQMSTTYPQRVYYTKLFQRQSLTTEQLTRVIESATRSFDSGYEKAELLLQVAKQPSFTEPVYLALAQMARSIDSDYERRRAFGALLARTDLRPEVVRTMLEATEGMRSDYELAELLLGIARRYAVDQTTRPYYVRALATINSDYEQRRVLTAILRDGGLTASATAELIEVAGRMMSGYELAEFLVQISGKGTLDQAASTAFFAAAKNVASDYERRRVLDALLRKGQLTRPVVEEMLATAATIDSDFECAELLVAVARTVKIDDALRPAFDKAAETIGSDYEYGRAMSAVRQSARRNESQR